jgi:hypothetical protein
MRACGEKRASHWPAVRSLLCRFLGFSASEERVEVFLVDQSVEAGDIGGVSEQDQGWDAHDSLLARGMGVVVDVDSVDGDLVAVAACEALQVRLERAARRAGGLAEVGQHQSVLRGRRELALSSSRIGLVGSAVIAVGRSHRPTAARSARTRVCGAFLTGRP